LKRERTNKLVTNKEGEREQRPCGLVFRQNLDKLLVQLKTRPQIGDANVNSSLICEWEELYKVSGVLLAYLQKLFPSTQSSSSAMPSETSCDSVQQCDGGDCSLSQALGSTETHDVKADLQHPTFPNLMVDPLKSDDTTSQCVIAEEQYSSVESSSSECLSRLVIGFREISSSLTDHQLQQRLREIRSTLTVAPQDTDSDLVTALLSELRESVINHQFAGVRREGILIIKEVIRAPCRADFASSYLCTLPKHQQHLLSSIIPSM